MLLAMVITKGIPSGHLLDPLPYDDLSFFQAVINLPIQKIVSEGAIKAFTKSLLRAS